MPSGLPAVPPLQCRVATSKRVTTAPIGCWFGFYSVSIAPILVVRLNTHRKRSRHNLLSSPAKRAPSFHWTEVVEEFQTLRFGLTRENKRAGATIFLLLFYYLNIPKSCYQKTFFHAATRRRRKGNRLRWMVECFHGQSATGVFLIQKNRGCRSSPDF
jgi:hypothetical protein